MPVDPSRDTLMPPIDLPSTEFEPGCLLRELEQRQDEVLEQLDVLDARLREVLLECGIRADDAPDQELIS